MCKVLRIPRSTYYYEVNKLSDREKEPPDEDVTEKIIHIFNTNRRCFGTRRIKIALDKQGLKVSRRRIGRIMKSKNLISTYTSLRYRAFPDRSNERNITNG
ncbi:IS3 family transposase, partial [Macrococcus brunensis]